MYNDTESDVTDEAQQPSVEKLELGKLAKEIKDCIAAAEQAETREKVAEEEAKQRFIAAGKLLVEARVRASNFRAFLKEYGISPSRAYELIDMAGGKTEQVRSKTA